MIVNSVSIEMEEESLNITYISFLVRFNKTQEIFPSVTRVLSIFLITAATSASVERVNSKKRVPKVLCLIPAASYAQRWALYSNNPAKEITSHFTCFPVNRKYSWQKSHVRTTCTTCKNRFSVYVDEERLESFMKEVPIIQKQKQQYKRFLYNKNLRNNTLIIKTVLKRTLHYN